MRVHLGLLPSHRGIFGPKPAAAAAAPAAAAGTPSRGAADEQDLMAAVLRSGGTYSTLHNQDAVGRFLEHVVSRGLTQYDNARDTATLLPAGLAISDFVSPASEPRRFSFDAHSTGRMAVAVAPLSPWLALRVCVRHVRRNKVISEQIVGRGGNATFHAALAADDIPRTDAWYEIEVEHVSGEELEGSGLFEISIETQEGTGWRVEREGHDEL